MPTQIPLPCGRSVLVDDEDAERLSQHSWHVDSSGYATRYLNGRGAKVRMHRDLLPDADKPEVDHINGNKLDNRRDNLRGATRSENQMNRGKQSGNYSSDYIGVSWNKGASKWMARITVEGETKYLGIYESEEAAARAYNDAAKEHHGEFCNLNPIPA